MFHIVLMNLESDLNDSRDVCEVRVTSRPFFYILIDKIKIRSLLLGGFGHEPWMRPWNVMVKTCLGPGLNKIEGKLGTMFLKREGEHIKSKKQTE